MFSSNFKDPNTGNFGIISPTSTPSWKCSFSNFSSSISLFETDFSFLPRLFKITTNNGSYQFNIEILRYFSPLIHSKLNKNKQLSEFHINIDDETNVMKKIEDLFQFETIEFSRSEIPIVVKIINVLQITKCPSYMKSTVSLDQESESSFTCALARYSVHEVFQNERKITIKVNNIEYRCNSVGLYSSAVFKEFIECDPETGEFSFDLEDGEDFSLMAQFFNFERITIDGSNVEFIQKMCNEFEITSLLPTIEEFLKLYSKTMDSATSKSGLVDSISSVFTLLYGLQSLTPEKVCHELINTQWVQTEENIQELVAMILQVIRTNILVHSKIIDLILLIKDYSNENPLLGKFCPFLINQVFLYFSESPLYSAFVYQLTERHLISLDIILRKLLNLHLLQTIKGADPFLTAVSYFIPEFLNYIKDISLRPLCSFDDMTESEYKHIRSTNEPRNELQKIIFYDDVDALQETIAKARIDIDSLVSRIPPERLFIQRAPRDDESDTKQEQCSLINYAAESGAINCFKYLLLNNASLTSDSFLYAVRGGNLEIIRTTYSSSLLNEQKKYMLDTKNQSAFGYFNFGNNQERAQLNCYFSVCLQSLLTTIQNHQYQLFDWILDQVAGTIPSLPIAKLINCCVENGNAYALLSFLNKDIDIFGSINSKEFNEKLFSNGYHHLMQFILALNSTLKFDHSIASQPSIIIHSGNLQILKVFCNEPKTHNLRINTIFYYAIQCEYYSIIDYIFNSFNYPNLKEDFYNIYKWAVKTYTSTMFKYITKLMPIESSKRFVSVSQYVEIINDAASYDNYYAVEQLTNHVLEINNDIDFTKPFLFACSANALDICDFFLKKKVHLNIIVISTNDQISLFLRDDIMFKLIDLVDEPFKRSVIDSFLIGSIKSLKLKTVQKLLEQNVPTESALLSAISTQSIEMVKLVLKYIDPSILDRKSSDSPLIAVLTSENLDLLDLFIDYYGPKIKDHVQQIQLGFKSLIKEGKMKSEIKSNGQESLCISRAMIKMLTKFCSIIGINFLTSLEMNHLILLTAIRLNEVEFVQFYLENVKDKGLYTHNTQIPLNSMEFFNDLKRKCDSPLYLAVVDRNIEICDLLIDFYHSTFSQGVNDIILGLQELLHNDYVKPSKKTIDFLEHLIQKLPPSLSYRVLSDGVLVQISIRNSMVKYFELYCSIIDKHRPMNPKYPFEGIIRSQNSAILQIIIEHLGETITNYTQEINQAFQNVFSKLGSDRASVRTINFLQLLISAVDINLNFVINGEPFINHLIKLNMLNMIEFYFDNVEDTSLLDSNTLTSPFAVALRSSEMHIIKLFLEYSINRDIDRSDLISQIILEFLKMLDESDFSFREPSYSWLKKIQNFGKVLLKVSEYYPVDVSISYHDRTLIDYFIADDDECLRLFSFYPIDLTGPSRELSPLYKAIILQKPKAVRVFIKSRYKQIIQLIDFINDTLHDLLRNLSDLLLTTENQVPTFKTAVQIVYDLVQAIPIDMYMVEQDLTFLWLAIRSNSIDFIQFFLKNYGKEPLFLPKNPSMSPFAAAIVNGNLSIINMLLEKYGIEIIKDHYEGINEALKSVLAESLTFNAEECINQSFQYNRIDRSRIDTFFNNILKVIDKIANIPNVDLNIYSSNYTLLTYATFLGVTKFVEGLIKYESVDVNLCELTNGNSPLMIAISNDDVELMKLFIECPRTDFRVQNYNNETAVIKAILNPNIPFETIMKPLLSRIDHNELDYAFYLSDDRIASHLISFVDLDVNYMHMKKDESFAKYMLYLYPTSLIHSILNEQFKKAEMIIKHPKFDPIKSDAKTALFLTVEKKNLRVFKSLLDYFDVNAMNSSSESLISWCYKYNFADGMMVILGDAKFDPVKSHLYELLIEAFSGIIVSEVVVFRIELLKQLLHYDEAHTHFMHFDQLLPNGKSLFTNILNSSTHKQATSTIANVIQLLLEKGVDPNKPDAYSIYPMQYAIEEKLIGLLQAFLQSGKVDLNVKINTPEIQNGTYLHLAALCSTNEILDQLLSTHFFDINGVDDFGETPLMKTAVSSNQATGALLAAQKGIDLEHLNNNQESLDDIYFRYGPKESEAAVSWVATIRCNSQQPQQKNHYPWMLKNKHQNY